MVRTRYPTSQQRLRALRITKLKNLVDVNIKFDERGLTAIFGPNGFGKSTVLHALAACFARPEAGVGKDYTFTDFFPNTPHGVWSGTKFIVSHKYNIGEEEHILATPVGKALGQWTPVGRNRPIRETYFIGVKSAVPKIEIQGTRKRIKYNTEELSDQDSNKLRKQAGIIFNRIYTKYHSNIVSRSRKFIGVESRGINYSSLAMGAGEQRVFEILSIVLKARNNALILIDEIDLLLHADALERMMKILNVHARKKELQIIFTTHRESILNFKDFIAIRHLYQGTVVPNKTFCFEETKPDAISRLTGKPHRPLSITCEDDVATAIIEKIASQVGIRRYVEITRFGAAINCFTLIAALMLNNKDMSNSLFVIDGDEYSTKEEKIKCICKVLTGDHPRDEERREESLTYVRQFVPTEIMPPEKVLHKLICSLQADGDAERIEVIASAKAIEAVDNNHKYIDNIIEALGTTRERGLTKIIDVAVTAEGWNDYVAPIREWFEGKRGQVIETTTL